MNIIKKGIMYLKSEGINSTFKKTLHKVSKETVKLPYVVYEKLFAKYKINLLKEEFRDKTVYIIIPCIDWNIPLYQRPHQIANELAKKDDAMVLFISDQYQYDRFGLYKKLQDKLWLYSIRLTKNLDQLLEFSKKKVVLMSWTRHSNLLNLFHYDKLIYEYIDELSLFYYYDDEMERIHRSLLKRADLTVCTAQKLYENAKEHTNKLILCENAGDYDFFYNNKNCDIAEELVNKISGYSCVIGYYGCLAYWFDYDIICKIALKRKDWLFVLIGYEFDQTSDVLKSKEYDNVIIIPPQPYTKLPSYVAAFDVQTIPFVINDITISTSPVKLFEYMASGKPIVASKLPECLKYESVLTYETAEEFIEIVEKVRNLKESDEYYKIMSREALENTWEARVNKILQNIEKGKEMIL